MKDLCSFMEDIMDSAMEADTYVSDDEIADDLAFEDELDEEDAFDDDVEIDEYDVEDITEESTGLDAFMEDINAETDDAVYDQILEDNTDFDDEDF